jgi:PAS domain S-box-containing protein
MDLHPALDQRQESEVNRAELDPIFRSLQENQDWYQDLVEHSQDLLCVHDLTGKLLSVNPAPARTLGYSVEELLKIPMRDLVAPESQREFDNYLDEIRRKGHASGVVPLITRSGERRVWRYRNTLRREGVDGPIVRGIAHDITDQLRREKEMREVGETLLSESREKDATIRTLKLFRALVDQTHDAIEVVDPVNLRFLDVNEKACFALGYSRGELLSLSVFDIDPAITRDSIVKILDELRTSGSLVIESVHRRKDGITFPVEVSIKRVELDRDYLIAVSRDLSERKQVEDALREKEKTQKLILDHLSVGVILSRVGDEQVFYQNPKCAELFGYSMADCPTVKEWWPRAYPDPVYREWVSQEWQRRMAKAAESQGEIEPMEVTVNCKDGSKKYVRVLAKVIGDLNFVSFIDLSKRRQAEARSQASEDRYRALYEHAPVGICRVESGTGRFLGVNAKYCEILGRSEQELLNLDFQSITHPDDLAGNLEQWRQLKGGTVRHYEMEKRYLRPDGTVRWVEIEVVAMWPAGAQPSWHMAIVQDVTERKKAENRLREYERVVEILEEMVVVVDRSYRYTLANKAFLQYWGLSEEQVVGHLVAEAIRPELFGRVAREKLDACFAGNVVKFELNIDYPGKGSRDISLAYSPVEGEGGIERAACVMRDITDQKQAEQAVRQSEGRERARSKELETVLAAVPVAVCIAYDRECLRMTGNPAAYDQLGVAPGSNISRSAPAAEQPSFRVLENGVEIPADSLPMQKVLATGIPEYMRPLTILREDGSHRETIANVVPLFDEEGKTRGAVAASIDVTELRRADDKVRASEARFRAVYERSPVGIALVDSDSYRLIEVNPKFCEIVGRAADEMHRLDIRAITHPEDLGNGIPEIALLVGGQLAQFEIETRYVRPDGSVRWARVLIVPMHGTLEINRRLVMALVDDITDYKQAEEALRQSVAHLQVVTEELREAKERLSEEKIYLEQAIDAELGFGEIIGRSSALKDVMGQVMKVAHSDATVLILGETGTGKELIARAIHRESRRKDKSFIKLNCAAIPSGLLESELFGHEKGAFTGAINKKVGRLELADQGTLFLDEIGEIPVELQPKLLRVLQDHEFERLGGTQTLKVNFRLVAATNRNLRVAMNQREFRSDLYYRLNVFPIIMPPLRERREDIPLLVEHFVRKYADRMAKPIASIPAKTMEVLVQWPWPGNIRELENFVERSVILTSGKVLQVSLSELSTTVAHGRGETLAERERERILRALRDCNGRLGGPNGAAARLGLKRTTLQSKLSHLGIDPGRFRSQD